MNAPSSVVSKKPIRHLADFSGKKIRIFASEFQIESFKRIGASPIAMSLGDVVPALQQGTIDASLGGIVVFTPMRFVDAAKYVTETGQPAVFVVAEINKKWYDSLPADLQKIVDRDAEAESKAINPHAIEIVDKARKGWTNSGGELISLPPDEQQSLLKTLRSVSQEVAKTKPKIAEAYRIVSEAAQRTQ
jgi:TRAP-type C4-dicarboxylate transport system substrate-binding protein